MRKYILGIVVISFLVTVAGLSGASAADYRELNKMLTAVQERYEFSQLTDDDKLIEFAAYIAMYETGDWGAEGSKEAVEAILNRYFGVEKINHEKSELYRSWPDQDVDYPLDGIGDMMFIRWIHVTELQELGNGMLLANADIYVSMDWESWNDSFFGPVSQWNLKSGGKILEGGSDNWWDLIEESDENIVRLGKLALTLKPFVFKGTDTWQIVNINGLEVPKVLFP